MLPSSNRAKSYHRAKEFAFLLSLVLFPVSLIFLVFSGLYGHLAMSLVGREQETLFHWPALLVAVYSFTAFFLMPVDYYSGFFLEKRFSLSTETFGSWLRDWLKKYLLSLVLFLVTALAFIAMVRYWPDHWWMGCALGYFLITFVLGRLFPKWIIPLFYKVEKLLDSDLKKSVLDLSMTCGANISEVYQIKLSDKTRKANAAVVGSGKARRILLSDTLLQSFNRDEVLMVMAHELGHYVKGHIRLSLAVQAVVAAVGFYAFFLISQPMAHAFGVASISDPVVFPWILILSFVASLVLMPAQNAFSRRLEREADRFALDKFRNRDVFASVMKKLAAQNLAEEDPTNWIEWLLYDHPSIGKRIREADRYLST